MKKFVGKILILVICMSMITIFGSISYADNDSDDAIELINDMRQALDINQLENNLELQNSALFHSKYMYYHDSYQIFEEIGSSFSRGSYPWDRAQFHGYNKQYITELISNGNNSFINDVNSMLENPYGRIDLLNPKYQDIGMSTYEIYNSFDLGGSGTAETLQVVYPYDNQVNVPIRWSNEYRFSPYAELGIINNSYGLPITYTYYAKDNDVEDIIVNNVAVTYGGSNLQFEILQPSEDRYLSNSIIIVPTETYDYGTTYEVVLNLTIRFDERADLNVTKTISFETVRNPNGQVIIPEPEPEPEPEPDPEPDPQPDPEPEPEPDPQPELNPEPESNPNISSSINRLLTRAIFTEETVKAVDYELLDATNMTFIDVDIDSETAIYIYTAYINNLIKGQSEYIFAPTLYITRQEAYTILVRAFEDKINLEISYSNTSPVNDYMNVSPWAMENECILKAAGAGFLVTNNYQNLIPQGHVSEKEFWEIISAFRDALDSY